VVWSENKAPDQQLREHLSNFKPVACKRCEELNFSALSRDLPNAIARAVKMTQHVKSIDLASNNLDGSGLEQILSALPKGSVLKN
jgi:hypothetical protein